MTDPSPHQETARKTRSGFLLTPPKKGLPKETHSFCPECGLKIPARVFEKDGKVYMSKTCPEHGDIEDVVYSKLSHYHRMEQYRFGDGVGVENPQVTDSTECPESCGLCRRHASHTALANIDLTNRCNLTCPVCFANANAAGYLYEPDAGQIRDMLQRFRDLRPVPCACVQFAGGEPTLHPDFPEIVGTARELGFSAIQVATNGLRFLEDGFLERCRDAGLNSVYLQWDAMDDDVYGKIRGEPLFEKKMEIFQAIRDAGTVNVILVPTIIKGVNDQEIGPILDFAVKNVDLVTGISFQPVAMTGRISKARREAGRFTLPDLAEAVEEQTGFAKADAWAPLSALVPLSRLAGAIAGRPVTAYTAHHHCSMATYLFVDPEGRPKQINEFLDFIALARDMDAIAENLEKSRFKFVTRSLSKLKALSALEKHFQPENAPEGLSFKVFMAAVEQLMGDKRDRQKNQPFAYRTLMVGGMHFMDNYNYDIERVQRCVVHYGAPNGRIYPFCAYNAGPTYRTQIEREFAHSPESVLRIAESEGFPKELSKLVEGAKAARDGQATGCARAICPEPS